MDVALIGAAMTPFGDRDAWIRELLAGAGRACLDDAPVGRDAAEHLYVSNMASSELEGQTGTMNALAHDLGVIPAYAERVDQTSAAGAAGVYEAW
jgi:acetyl-CoA C-acetyltransferase